MPIIYNVTIDNEEMERIITNYRNDVTRLNIAFETSERILGNFEKSISFTVKSDRVNKWHNITI